MAQLVWTITSQQPDICHFFSTDKSFGSIFSTQEGHNCDGTYFATKQRKLQQNRLCDKASEIMREKDNFFSQFSHEEISPFDRFFLVPGIWIERA